MGFSEFYIKNLKHIVCLVESIILKIITTFYVFSIFFAYLNTIWMDNTVEENTKATLGSSLIQLIFSPLNNVNVKFNANWKIWIAKKEMYKLPLREIEIHQL